MRTKRPCASIHDSDIRIQLGLFFTTRRVSERFHVDPSLTGEIVNKIELCVLAVVISVLFPTGMAQAQTTSTVQHQLAPSNASSIESTVVTTDPNQLVLSALHRAVWGPPIACKVHQKSQAYQQLVVVSGEYKAAGTGTGQFRYTARVSSGDTTMDTVQVSDGRLMYTQIGEDEPPKRVIIDQVRQALGNAIFYADDRPEISIYLAIGGQAELLRNLYHRYNWYAAKAGKINGVDVWQLVGRLRTEPPRIFGTSLLDQENLRQPPPDAIVPSEVRLTLGRSASMPYFPYCIEYFHRVIGTDGKTMVPETVSKIVYSDPIATTVSEKDFTYRVQDSVGKIDAATAQYIPTGAIAGQNTIPLK
jgi:hypothetical protein